MKGLTGIQQEYKPQVYARSEETYHDDALAFAVKLAKTKPVITFGLTWPKNYKFGLPKDAFIELCSKKDIEDLLRV